MGSFSISCGKMACVKDVNAEEFVKTGLFKELSPDDDDWFYTRCAAIMRHLYFRKGAGVGALTKVFGGRKRNGTAPSHFSRASGKILRDAFKSLEQMKLVEKHPGGGRKLTPTGVRDMDRI